MFFAAGLLKVFKWLMSCVTCQEEDIAMWLFPMVSELCFYGASPKVSDLLKRMLLYWKGA